MVCIGTIVKSHKTDGHFLCQLFNSLELDEQGQHRLSELKQVELRSPRKKHISSKSIFLPLEEFEITGRSGFRSVLLKSPLWAKAEQVKFFHGWELWAEDQYASSCGDDEFLYCELMDTKVYICTDDMVKNQSKENYCLLGYVINLFEGGAQLLLEIQLCVQRYPQHKTMYLPFHSSIIGRVERRVSIEILDLAYFESLL